MSTTAPTSSATEQARDLRDVYSLLVLESPEVCGRCHARIRDRETHDTNTLGTGNRPGETVLRVGQGEVGYDVETHDEYGAVRTHHARTYCGNCGQPGGAAPDDTPSKRELLAAVSPLVDRLAESGIPCNEAKLREYIGHLRSQERFCGRETEIWRVSTARAIRKARPRDCVRATCGRA